MLYGVTRRKINKGLYGEITEIDGDRITVRTINSEHFNLNDTVRLDTVPYTTIGYSDGRKLSIYDLNVGDKIKVRYLSQDIDRDAFTIANILNIEVTGAQ